MMKTDVSNVKGLDPSQDTALTSDVTNVMSIEKSSWTVLTKYLLQNHHQHIIRRTEVTRTNIAQVTTGIIRKEETTLDHILDTADIAAPVVMTCTEAVPDHRTETDTAAIEVAQDSSTPYTGDIVTDPAVTHPTGHTTHIAVIQTTTLETAAEHRATYQAATLETTVDPSHDHPTNHQSIALTKRDLAAQYHIPIMETTSPT